VPPQSLLTKPSAARMTGRNSVPIRPCNWGAKLPPTPLEGMGPANHPLGAFPQTKIAWPPACSLDLQMYACLLASLAASLLTAASINPGVGGEAILVKMVQNNSRRSTIAYTGLRQYTLHNARFSAGATMSVRLRYLPGEGKQFTVLERSGSEKLSRILDKLLEWEAQTSRPSEIDRYGITPENYVAELVGTDVQAGRTCFVLKLLARTKSRFLVNGKAWVDHDSFELLRLEAVTAASISMWVGQPHITQEFSETDGIWLPVHVKSASASLLLGSSDLDIRFNQYEVDFRTQDAASDTSRANNVLLDPQP
jgi:hypothetical protein